MKRKLLLSALIALLPVACEHAPTMDPLQLDPQFANSNGGHHLRNTDTNTPMPSDTTVGLQDTLRMALAAGNGNGPQNNKNVQWSSSNATAVAITPDKGTVVAVAQALGTSIVCATLGGNSTCVTINVSAGPGHHYLVTSSSNTPNAGGSVTITAQLLDVANNPVSQSGRIVSWSSTNGGSFSAPTSTTNASGTATTTFTTSTVAGTSHVVTALDNFGQSGSSAPIVTQTGPAVNMVGHAGDGQSATVGTAVAVSPAVRVTDQHGNPVSGVAVTFAVTSGGGSVTGANQVTDANGVATVGSWTLGNTPGSNTLDATSPGLPAVTFTATATVGNATQLVMHTQPSSTVQAGIAFPQQPAVQLRDGLNNDVPTAGVVVTASINSGAGTLAGTLTATTDANGRATFTNLRIDGATGTRVLEFSASGVSSAVSNAVNVVAGPADHLAIVTQPSSTAQAGVAFAQQPAIRLEDAFNNPVAQAGVAVSAAINSGGGTLLGTTGVNTDGSGTATFTDLAIGGTVGARTLAFSASGVTGATSNTINVVAGPASEIVLSTPATTVLVGSTITITGQLRDQYTNPVLIAGIAVTWSSTNGGAFASNPTSTDANGQTTVNFTVSNAAAVTHDVTATAGAATGTIQITTFNNPPTAGNDSFNAIGNVTIPVSAPGVLANDSDGETSASAVPAVITTANGGQVNLNADGSFTYLSAAGYTGSDSWTYSVSDGSLTASATVTMNVPTRVWFVKNDATAPGDGRDASPFVLLSAAQSASAANETIYVYRGNGTNSGYNTGFIFKVGQSLIGQGIPAPVTTTLNGGTVTIFAADGNAPNLTRSGAGITVTLAQNSTLRGFSVGSTAGIAINGNNFGTFTIDHSTVASTGGPALALSSGTISGTIAQLSSSASPSTGVTLTSVGGSLTAPAGTIAGSLGVGFFVNGGAPSITYGGNITVTTGVPVQLQARNGGLIEFSGTITSTAAGILLTSNSNGTARFSGIKSLTTATPNPGVNLTNNAGSTIEFTGGGLHITTSGANGFAASGGGTVSVTGSNNTITSVNSPALNVQNVTVGVAGLNFERISANGGANGIVLANTGPNPALTVTGTGAAGSGGTIQNMSGADGLQAGNGVYLSGASGVSLSYMQINNHSNHAIRGFNVNQFELSSSSVGGSNGDNAALFEGSVAFDVLTGNATIRNSIIAGGFTDNIRVTNTTGVLDRLTLDGTTVGLNSAANGRHGLFVLASGAGTAKVTVQSSSFLGARGSLFFAQAQGAGTTDAVLSGNSFINAHSNTAGGGGNVVVDGFGTGFNITYGISGNTFQGALGNALAVSSTGAGRLTGTIHNNDIGLPATANSGSTQGSGLSVTVTGGAKHTSVMTNNRVRQYNNQGILLQIGDQTQGGNGELNATLTGNTVSNPGTAVTAKNGIHLNAGTITNDNPKVCLAIGGAGALANSITGSGSGGAAGTDFRLRQRMLTAVALPGYVGANNDNAAVTLFVQNNNGVTPTGLAQNTVSTGGGGFVGGPACPTS